MSSAHVYLRLKDGQTIEDIPAAVLEECAQLVKSNSIEGSKASSVMVSYTPFQNLRKDQRMDVGQVGFHNDKSVRRTRVEKTDKDMVKRLNKTKVDRSPDTLGEEKEAHVKELLRRVKASRAASRKEEAVLELERKVEREARSYDRLFDETKMKSNIKTDGAFDSQAAAAAEEDFM